ncbi:M20/M25/M40 family metallo-hydrolase [Microbacterium sp. NPDC058342]|uniref:M20/M25/M40 family metallo-hydrolase n=1 Tax=Microbacterium sp. NPDC058342 TaxID=3346454 RepID=UPI0036518BBA
MSDALSPIAVGSPISPSVVELCSQLIAIDSSNYGPGGPNGERAVADYIVERLTAVGYEPVVLESAPGRANVLLRVPGRESGLDAFLVHGHTDVVPAEADQWSVDPFAGVIKDGYIWGRGAMDMKDMVASTLSTLLRWKEKGTGPRRDMVFAFVADEEAGGTFGAQWLVSEHPEWFAGVGAAISEGGGTPVSEKDADGKTHWFYPVGTAERGTLHMRLRATGESGHASRGWADNAVTHLIDALGRLAHHGWPISLIPTSRAFIEQTAAELGIAVDLSTDEGVEAALVALGPVLRSDVPTRGSLNPTVLQAGYKVNVIPGVAEAEIDVRSIPGTEEKMLEEIDHLLGPRVTREFIAEAPGISAPFDSEWFSAIADAIVAADDEAVVLPYLLGGGTDAKAFAKLGIPGYGFAPLGRDPEGRREGGMHGVDERMPIAALEIGATILEKFLTEV